MLIFHSQNKISKLSESGNSCINSLADYESTDNYEAYEILKNEFRKKSAENLIHDIILNEFSREIPFLEAKVKEKLFK